MDSAFRSMLPSEVQRVPYTSEDSFGNATYGTPVSTRALIEDVRLTYGGETQGGKEAKMVTQATAVVDVEGWSLGDKLVIGAVTYYVVGDELVTDWDGAPHHHLLELSTTRKG